MIEFKQIAINSSEIAGLTKDNKIYVLDKGYWRLMPDINNRRRRIENSNDEKRVKDERDENLQELIGLEEDQNNEQ